MRDIAWPAGTRHKDRDAICESLKRLEASLTEEQLETVITLVEIGLLAGGRKVPSHIWTRT